MSPEPPEPPSSRGLTGESRSSGPTIPPLPAALLDPRPVIGVGMLLWTVAAVAAFTAAGLHSWRPVTLAGLGVGLLGTAIFGWQRSAARRRVPGAQTGLEHLDT